MNFKNLFAPGTMSGSIGPQFQWNILNYGRLRNNVLLQDALLKDLLVGYQTTVLQASQEAENGIVTFLRAQVQAKLLQESVRAANHAVAIVIFQYEKGAADFNRYATIEQALVTQQDLYAQSQGLIAQGLVQVYRALGGGWEIRCPALPGVPPSPYEARQELPMPLASPPTRSPETIPPPPTVPPVILPQR
jgi:outer membrane protein TolC